MTKSGKKKNVKKASVAVQHPAAANQSLQLPKPSPQFKTGRNQPAKKSKCPVQQPTGASPQVKSGNKNLGSKKKVLVQQQLAANQLVQKGRKQLAKKPKFPTANLPVQPVNPSPNLKRGKINQGRKGKKKLLFGPMRFSRQDFLRMQAQRQEFLRIQRGKLKGVLKAQSKPMKKPGIQIPKQRVQVQPTLKNQPTRQQLFAQYTARLRSTYRPKGKKPWKDIFKHFRRRGKTKGVLWMILLQHPQTYYYLNSVQRALRLPASKRTKFLLHCLLPFRNFRHGIGTPFMAIKLKVLRRLMKKLRNYWPNLNNFKEFMEFMMYEYEKHGLIQSLLTQVEYFKFAVKVYETLKLEELLSYMRKRAVEKYPDHCNDSPMYPGLISLPGVLVEVIVQEFFGNGSRPIIQGQMRGNDALLKHITVVVDSRMKVFKHKVGDTIRGFIGTDPLFF